MMLIRSLGFILVSWPRKDLIFVDFISATSTDFGSQMKYLNSVFGLYVKLYKKCLEHRTSLSVRSPKLRPVEVALGHLLPIYSPTCTYIEITKSNLFQVIQADLAELGIRDSKSFELSHILDFSNWKSLPHPDKRFNQKTHISIKTDLIGCDLLVYKPGPPKGTDFVIFVTHFIRQDLLTFESKRCLNKMVYSHQNLRYSLQRL